MRPTLYGALEAACAFCGGADNIPAAVVRFLGWWGQSADGSRLAAACFEWLDTLSDDGGILVALADAVDDVNSVLYYHLAPDAADPDAYQRASQQVEALMALDGGMAVDAGGHDDVCGGDRWSEAESATVTSRPDLVPGAFLRLHRDMAGEAPAWAWCPVGPAQWDAEAATLLDGLEHVARFAQAPRCAAELAALGWAMAPDPQSSSVAELVDLGLVGALEAPFEEDESIVERFAICVAKGGLALTDASTALVIACGDRTFGSLCDLGRFLLVDIGFWRPPERLGAR